MKSFLRKCQTEKNMRIAINLIPFIAVSGIEVFTRNLILNLLKVKKDKEVEPAYIQNAGGVQLRVALYKKLKKK